MPPVHNRSGEIHRLKDQAGAWFERGSHDIETAQLLLDRQGYTDIIAFHIHQAVEKYL
ncbi:MAG: HEPN domain-containing protein, partial [Candidatus Brocadiales bacterium]|nr:HEPN domain-containing protein [Candidatus Bathyanammoxibius sp.]